MTNKNADSIAVDLTEYMVNNLLTEEPTIEKVIGIYPGRFQPAGVHHYNRYKWLDK